MDRLRVPIILNKGRIGIPLRKLGAIVKETETFLKMLADDTQLPGDKGEWLALDFKSGSVIFIAEYIPSVDKDHIVNFGNAFKDIQRGSPSVQVRSTTRYQYAKIAEQLDEDEQVEFGICEDVIKEVFEYVPLSKRDLPVIVGERQGPVESIGSIQGVIHSVFMRSTPKHFFVRELSTDNLIKCEYSSSIYPQLAKVLREEATVIHVYGFITTDLASHKVERLVAQKLEAASQYLSDKEFEQFFGCCPTLTGNLSTEEFIDQIRKHDND